MKPAIDATPPYLPGQFVWCLFPFSEAPQQPGLKEHVGYVADIRQKHGAFLTVMALYTTARQWNESVVPPLGVVQVDQAAARRMGHRDSFVLDARRIAFIPVQLRFFPRLEQPDKGIIGVAPRSFQQNIQNVLAQLARRPDLIQVVGPDLK